MFKKHIRIMVKTGISPLLPPSPSPPSACLFLLRLPAPERPGLGGSGGASGITTAAAAAQAATQAALRRPLLPVQAQDGLHHHHIGGRRDHRGLLHRRGFNQVRPEGD